MPRGIPKPTLVVNDQVTPDENTEYQSLFLQALRNFLPTLKLYSDAMLVNKIGKDRTIESSLELFGFLEDAAGPLTKNEKLALAQQCFSCLSKYITTNLRIPVTLKTLLDSMSLLLVAVDDCFPGYAGSHLLKFAIVPFPKQVA